MVAGLPLDATALKTVQVDVEREVVALLVPASGADTSVGSPIVKVEYDRAVARSPLWGLLEKRRLELEVNNVSLPIPTGLQYRRHRCVLFNINFDAM